MQPQDYLVIPGDLAVSTLIHYCESGPLLPSLTSIVCAPSIIFCRACLHLNSSVPLRGLVYAMDYELMVLVASNIDEVREVVLL